MPKILIFLLPLPEMTKFFAKTLPRKENERVHQQKVGGQGGKSGGIVAQMSARKGTDTHAKGVHAEKG